MPRERQLHICVLNIAANPHPEGTYVSLLMRASNFLARARASDYAKITAPVQDERNGRYWAGRILIWTEIDLKGPWLDITKEDELSNDLKKMINIPAQAKPNYRVFNYILDNTRHMVYFESRNEFGQNLGPSVAKTIFTTLLSFEVLGPGYPEVEVTLVPETGAVERVLALPGLRMLYIRVVRPNPDVSDEARRRVWGRLEQAHAAREEVIFTKAAGAARLTPPEDIEELAAIAAENGEVRGEGRYGDGAKAELSTSDHPQRIYAGIDHGGTFLARLLSALRG